MHYPTKTISRELPANLHSLGIALSKSKTSSAVALAAFKCKGLRQAMVNRSCLELDKECRKLVRKKKSLLKCTSLEELKAFKWSKLMKEWRKEAPTLYKVLGAIASHFSKRNMQSLRPVIGSAGAMLLKARNKQMSAVQHLVGLSLFLGRTRKKVCFKISFFSLAILLLLNTSQLEYQVTVTSFISVKAFVAGRP